MIDVSELVFDPDFCQPFTLLRSATTFVLGGTQDTVTQIPMYGAVQVADAKTLAQVPEGDRVEGSRVFWSFQPMYQTNSKGTSDVIEYRSQQYRIAKIWVWTENGYYKAFGVRMSGR